MNIVIIPTYNERDNLRPLVEAILELDCCLNILIVDDNSPDGTGELAESLARGSEQVRVLRRTGKRGFGRSYVDGFKYALERGYERIITMDADFSHDPKYIPDLLEASNRADVVIGSRYLNGVSVVNWSIQRLLISFLANRYVKLITGLPVNDCTAGFGCYSRRAIEQIEPDSILSEGYSFLVEVKFRALRKGLSLAEVPIIFVERRAGHSKLSKKIMFEAALMPLKLRWRAITGQL